MTTYPSSFHSNCPRYQQRQRHQTQQQTSIAAEPIDPLHQPWELDQDHHQQQQQWSYQQSHQQHPHLYPGDSGIVEAGQQESHWLHHHLEHLEHGRQVLLQQSQQPPSTSHDSWSPDSNYLGFGIGCGGQERPPSGANDATTSFTHAGNPSPFAQLGNVDSKGLVALPFERELQEAPCPLTIDHAQTLRREQDEWLSHGIGNGPDGCTKFTLSQAPQKWGDRQDDGINQEYSLHGTNKSYSPKMVASGATLPADAIRDISKSPSVLGTRRASRDYRCQSTDTVATTSSKNSGSPTFPTAPATNSAKFPVIGSSAGAIDAREQKRAEEILKQIRTRAPDSKEGVAACDYCRKRKIKCNRDKPSCGRCISARRICSTTDTLRKRGPPSKKERELLAAQGIHFVPSRFRKKCDFGTRGTSADDRHGPVVQNSEQRKRSPSAVGSLGGVASSSSLPSAGDEGKHPTPSSRGAQSASSPPWAGSPVASNGGGSGGDPTSTGASPQHSCTLDETFPRASAVGMSTLLPNRPSTLPVASVWPASSEVSFSSSRERFHLGVSFGRAAEGLQNGWTSGSHLDATSFSIPTSRLLSAANPSNHQRTPSHPAGQDIDGRQAPSEPQQS